MFAEKRTIGMLLAAVAVLFTLALVGSASAAPFTYTGKVVTLDKGYGSLTVQAGPNDYLIFNVHDNAGIMRCNESVSFNSVKVGDEVTVSYYEESGGNFIADNITLSPGMMGEFCS